MRNVTVILAASGWGAGNFATADGALTVLQYQLLNSLFEYPDIHAEVYYAQWHLNSHQKSKSYSIEQRRKYVLQSARWVSELVEKAVCKGNFVLVIGGDHSLAMGTWSGAKNADKDFGLIWIDAHMDAHTYETTASYNPHGMPVAALLGMGDSEFVGLAKNSPALNPSALIQTGIRSFEEEEKSLLGRLAVSITYHQKSHSYSGVENFSKSRETLLKTYPFFAVSLDIDGIDPTYCPGTGTPEGEGLELDDIIQSLKGILFDSSCIGLEIVEYNPFLDRGHITFNAVKKIIDTIKIL